MDRSRYYQFPPFQKGGGRIKELETPLSHFDKNSSITLAVVSFFSGPLSMQYTFVYIMISHGIKVTHEPSTSRNKTESKFPYNSVGHAYSIFELNYQYVIANGRGGSCCHCLSSRIWSRSFHSAWGCRRLLSFTCQNRFQASAGWFTCFFSWSHVVCFFR